MSVNKVILIGNVGKDPDVRYLDNNVAVATFSLATTERGYTLSNGTKVPDRTEWHNIVLWKGLAQTAEKYVHKGDKLYLEGKLKYRSYEDKNGMTRNITEIFVDSMEMLSPKGGTSHTNPVASSTSQVAENINSQSKETSAESSSDDLPF